MKTKLNLALALVVASTFGAAEADAQGRGRGDDRDRDELRDDRRRDHDDRRPRFERRDDDRRRDDRAHGVQRRVPPGWCQGRGNPHNTAENCRYNTRHSRWERYDSRTRRYETYEGYTRNRAAYDRAHRDFHVAQDRRCRERQLQARLDVRRQVQIRNECKVQHDAFHRRWNIAHR